MPKLPRNRLNYMINNYQTQIEQRLSFPYCRLYHDSICPTQRPSWNVTFIETPFSVHEAKPKVAEYLLYAQANITSNIKELKGQLFNYAMKHYHINCRLRHAVTETRNRRASICNRRDQRRVIK